MYLFEGLKLKVSKYLPDEQVQLVQDSFAVARDAHDGQQRSSGDPYITHPVAVAAILADMHMDHETLMGALLHDVIEDTHHDKDSLQSQFRNCRRVSGRGFKLDKFKFWSKEAQAKFGRWWWQWWRILELSLSNFNRTHNMRT